MFASVVLAGSLQATQPGVAEPRLALGWDTPPACVELDEAILRLRELLARPPTIVDLKDEAELRAEVEIIEMRDGGFRATLRFDGPRGYDERSFDDARCDVVAEAAVLVIVVSLDPVGTVDSPWSSPSCRPSCRPSRRSSSRSPSHRSPRHRHSKRHSSSLPTGPSRLNHRSASSSRAVRTPGETKREKDLALAQGWACSAVAATAPSIWGRRASAASSRHSGRGGARACAGFGSRRAPAHSKTT